MSTTVIKKGKSFFILRRRCRLDRSDKDSRFHPSKVALTSSTRDF